MAVDSSQSPETLAALLAEAATRPFAPVFGLPSFLKRYIIKPAEATLPSGLEPDEAAKLASAVAAALHEVSFPITNATFQPENIRVKPIPGGWKVILELETGAALSKKGSQAAFGGLLYRLAEGQEFALDFSEQKAQLTQLRQHNPYLANVLEEAVNGRFSSAEALAGGFGWSLYRQTHLNNAVSSNIETQNARPTGQAKPVAQLPGETITPKTTANRAWGGPVAMVSLLVALVLLAGTILFSINDLDNTYQKRSQVLPTHTPQPTIAPTPTPAQALQINRQTDGANLTRYNPALDPITAGERYVDPAKLTAGQVAAITNFNIMQVESVRWSADGQKVDLAMTNGGWETWDLAARQRLARKEMPNIEQFLSVSWSPDGQNFVAVGMDGQMRLGKNGRVIRTVAYEKADIDAGGSAEYPAEYSWSPDSNFVLMTVADNHLQFWNFQNTPALVEPVSTELSRSLNMRGSRLKGQFAWSADSRYLARIAAGKSNPMIEIYNPRNLAQLYEIAVTDSKAEPEPGQSSNPFANETLTLAWSPDGRYMAVSRPYNSELSGDAYSINPEGSLVSILEIPDLSNWVTPAPGRQVSPPTQGRPNITPATDGNPSRLILPANAAPLKPLHIETVVLTGLTNLYYTGSGHLAWSGNNRLLVIGSSPSVLDNTQTLYKGLTLSLESAWHWQIDSTFDLPFEAPQFSTWLPDNRHFLFNTYTNLLGVGLAPEQPGQPLTTEIYQKSAGQSDLEFLPSPDGRYFLQTGNRYNRPALVIRETASGTVKGELALPAGDFVYAGKARWSPDGRYLAMSFVIQGDNNGGTPNSTQILRAWRIEPDKAPTLIGDLLVPAFFGGGFDINSSLEWDGTETGPAVFFEYEGYNIGRWDLNKLPPSLILQEQEVQKNSVNIMQSTTEYSYFKVMGRISGKVSNSGNGNWTWLPDHKRLVYCNTQCYIQDLLAPGATYTAEQARGTRFDPQPLSGTAQSSSILGSPLISPDGRIVVIALPGGLLNLYDATSGKLFNSFTAHQGSISALNFSPDGRYLVTGGSDRAVKVWDTTSWRNLAVLRVVTTASNISRLEWLPDNKTLAVGANYRGSLLYWRALA